MPAKTYKVEIGFNNQLSGVITFGFTDSKTPVTFAVTNKALTTNVATITAAGHAVVAGDTISVAGVDVTFNTTGVVASSVTATTISYAKTAANVTSIAATGTVGVVTTVDTFSNAFTNFFDGPDDDVTEDVESIRIKRGRDGLLAQMNAGTAELDIRRPTNRAYWNPSNTASALHVDNAPGFVPMRPIRITASNGVINTGLFFGFVRSARYSHDTGICRLSCVDLFIFLDRAAVLDPAFSTTQGGTGDTSFVPDEDTALEVQSAVVTSTSRGGFIRTASL